MSIALIAGRGILPLEIAKKLKAVQKNTLTVTGKSIRGDKTFPVFVPAFKKIL